MKKLFAIVFMIGMLRAGAQTAPPSPSDSLGLQIAADMPRPALPIVPEASTLKKRKWIVGSVSAGVYASSLVALNKAWYKDYPKTSFHTFNDGGEWRQVDKVGHAWSSYTLSRGSAAAWNWAYGQQAIKGEVQRAAWLGAASGFTYLTVIEFLDAHSANWGWSWPDMAANAFGSGLFLSQELLWKEQRIQYKFSSHRNKYDAGLEARADALFGTSLPERLLKDYNAQSYWFSFNLRSFFPRSSLPPWLSVSVGYGATGLFGGFSNLAYDKDGNISFDRRDISRRRQWYLAPDIDLSKIKTRSRFLRTTLTALNALKFPAPALEFSSGKLKLRGIVF